MAPEHANSALCCAACALWSPSFRRSAYHSSFCRHASHRPATCDGPPSLAPVCFILAHSTYHCRPKAGHAAAPPATGRPHYDAPCAGRPSESRPARDRLLATAPGTHLARWRSCSQPLPRARGKFTPTPDVQPHHPPMALVLLPTHHCGPRGQNPRPKPAAITRGRTPRSSPDRCTLHPPAGAAPHRIAPSPTTHTECVPARHVHTPRGDDTALRCIGAAAAAGGCAQHRAGVGSLAQAGVRRPHDPAQDPRQASGLPEALPNCAG